MMDPSTNRFVPVSDEDTEKIKELSDSFKGHVTNLKTLGKIDDIEEGRRFKEGPPIFKQGEILNIKGYAFRVSILEAKRMVLRPYKEQ